MGEGEAPCREILGLIAARRYNGFICAECGEEVAPGDRGAGVCAAAACAGAARVDGGGKRIRVVDIFLEEGIIHKARCIALLYPLACDPVFGAKLKPRGRQIQAEHDQTCLKTYQKDRETNNGLPRL